MSTVFWCPFLEDMALWIFSVLPMVLYKICDSGSRDSQNALLHILFLFVPGQFPFTCIFMSCLSTVHFCIVDFWGPAMTPQYAIPFNPVMHVTPDI